MAYMQQTREQYATPRSDRASRRTGRRRWRSGLLAVDGAQDAAIGTGRRQETLHHQTIDHIAKFSSTVFLLGIIRSYFVAGRQHDGPGLNLHIVRLLSKVNRLSRAGLKTFAAEEAIVDVNQCFLWHCRCEGDVDDAVGRAAEFVCIIRQVEWTDQFTRPATGARVFDHVARFFQNPGDKAALIARHRLYITVGQQFDIFVMGYGSHLGGGDATATVERGEDLTEADHLSADTWTLLYQRHAIPLIREVESRLHAGYPTPDDQAVHVKPIQCHANLLLTLTRLGCLDVCRVRCKQLTLHRTDFRQQCVHLLDLIEKRTHAHGTDRRQAQPPGV